MSDFSSVISNQISWAASQHARETGDAIFLANANAMAAQQNYDRLWHSYEDLRQAYAKLEELTEKTVRLNQQCQEDARALIAENEELRLKLLDVTSELRMMRGLDRQLHPEAYENRLFAER